MPNQNPLVFLLEDDRDLSAVLRRSLSAHGFKVECFNLYREFDKRLALSKPQICVVDACLPDQRGFEGVMKRLAGEAIPAIVISGIYTELPDRVLGLELGADDFLLKPFNPRELVARINAVMRRAIKAKSSGSRTARFAGWEVHFDSLLLITPDRTQVALGASEARLLRFLVSNPQRVLKRETLLDHVSASDTDVFDRSIDVRISRLRTKLGDDARSPKLIRTVYGEGYMFAPSVSWD